MLCAAYTPSAIGADPGEIPIPYDYDGSTPVKWLVNRISLRVQSPGGAPAVRIEKSSGTGIFNPVTVGSLSLVSGAADGSVTTISEVNSGDKIRFYVLALGTAANWTVSIEISSL